LVNLYKIKFISNKLIQNLHGTGVQIKLLS